MKCDSWSNFHSIYWNALIFQPDNFTVPLLINPSKQTEALIVAIQFCPNNVIQPPTKVPILPVFGDNKPRGLLWTKKKSVQCGNDHKMRADVTQYKWATTTILALCPRKIKRRMGCVVNKRRRCNKMLWILRNKFRLWLDNPSTWTQTDTWPTARALSARISITVSSGYL
jgi:hypothetical protein